jgi:hypothetical protein
MIGGIRPRFQDDLIAINGRYCVNVTRKRELSVHVYEYSNDHGRVSLPSTYFRTTPGIDISVPHRVVSPCFVIPDYFIETFLKVAAHLLWEDRLLLCLFRSIATYTIAELRAFSEGSHFHDNRFDYDTETFLSRTQLVEPVETITEAVFSFHSPTHSTKVIIPRSNEQQPRVESVFRDYDVERVNVAGFENTLSLTPSGGVSHLRYIHGDPMSAMTRNVYDDAFSYDHEDYNSIGFREEVGRVALYNAPANRVMVLDVGCGEH